MISKPNRPLRQTDAWASFMESLSWRTERVDGVLVLIRSFPFRLGSFAKVLDLDQPLSWSKLSRISKKHRVWQFHLQTVFEQGSKEAVKAEENFQTHGLKPTLPLTPSKTSLIDLTQSQTKLLTDFAPAARRAVRRGEKLGVQVKKSSDIQTFASLWQSRMRRKGDWLAGTKEILTLWQAFQDNTHLLVTQNQEPTAKLNLAKAQKSPKSLNAGVLLIQNGRTLHYMHATSTPEANQDRAPTLLVWEALKLGQKLGCSLFDFEGIYDKRFPGEQKSWQGFSRFKQGFGGKPVSYLSPYRKTKIPLLSI